MPRALGSALLLLAMAAGCEREAEATQDDAERQRPIPCIVLAHGMGAMLDSLEGRPAPSSCDASIDPQSISIDEFVRVIPDQHPAFYYFLASRLFEAGRRDDAVFWLYAGVLRYRTRLTCHRDLPPDVEPALFASLYNSVGDEVFEYAGGDPDAWAATVERVLAWDAETRNGFEPRAPCREAIVGSRRRMSELIAYVRANKEQIRRQRTANGLQNR